MPSRRPALPTVEALDDALLREIAERGGVRHFPANAVLVTEDDRSDALFIVLAGRVKVYGAGEDGREVVYGTMSKGEYFGEMTLDGGPRSASVTTLEPTSCAVVPGVDVRDFLAHHPDFALHLVKKLIRRARDLTEQVKSLALEDVYGRIARLLRTLARDENGVPTLPEKLTQQDIAERIGASREMVSRVMKDLETRGFIEALPSGATLLKTRLATLG